MEKCQKKALILYKGYPSLWDGVDWLSLSFESVIDLAGFSAKFRLGNFTFENSNLFEDWIINLTAEETGTLPLGMNTASLIVYDALGEGKPFTTSIPILVKDWVQGDVEIDTYKAVVKATLDNQTQIAIRIETAKVSLDWVEGKIAEHNNSTEAHSYIQGLISSEKEARENADSSLSQRITENTNRFSNYRTRVQQDVIDNNLQEQINAVSGDLSNYRTAADQDIIDNAQNTAINGKQAKLNTVQMNAVNSGITSAKVSSYDSHIANTTIHVTAQDKQTWNAKQNALNSTQMDAVNSGITSTGVTQITTNKNNIADEITNRENADGELQDQINNLKARGRFLALWNCATGLAESNPPSGTYTYQSGDYFIIGVVAQAGQNNYKPDGSTYTTGVASTVIETQQVDTDDVYYYDGHVWRLQVNTQKEIGFVNIAGSPYDNTNLASALNSKQNELTQGTGIDITSNEISVDFSEVATASQGSLADTAVQPGDLASVATSGSYEDLNNKPTIPSINSNNNYVPYRSSSSAFGNSTLLYNSNAMAFTGKLHIGSSSPSSYYDKGRVTIYDNTPSQQVSSLALLNYGGGGGCGVAIDMYNTNANGGIPSGRFGVVDNGNYSGYLQLQVKKSGGPNNPLLPAMNIVPVPASNSLTTCVSFGQDEFNRVLFDLHKPEATVTITDSDKRWAGSGTTYYVSGNNKFNTRLLVAVGDIVSFDNFTTEATVTGIISNSSTLQITTDKTLGSISNQSITVKKAYFKITDESDNIKVYVDPYGKFAIGTLTPTYELDVSGTINASTDVKINGQSVGLAGIFYYGE